MDKKTFVFLHIVTLLSPVITNLIITCYFGPIMTSSLNFYYLLLHPHYYLLLLSNYYTQLHCCYLLLHSHYYLFFRSHYYVITT